VFLRKNLLNSFTAENDLTISTTFSKTRIHPKFWYQSEYCRLIRYFLVRIRIDSWCSRTATNSLMQNNVRVWTYVLLMLVPAQLLSSWGEQRPSNKADLDSSVTVEFRKLYYTRMDLRVISFLYHSTSLLLCRVLNGTGCVSHTDQKAFLYYLKSLRFMVAHNEIFFRIIKSIS
jgi:hypothetical protein